MKNILVIAMDIGHSAPGIVYGKLLQQIGNRVNCYVLCPKVNSSISLMKVYSPQYKSLPFRAADFLYTTLGTNIKDVIWSIKVFRFFQKSKNIDYDCVISFVSSGNYAPIIAGELLSSKWKKPWVIYTVDAIPPPVSWSNNPRLTKSVSRFLKRWINHASGIFAANPMMLAYVKSIFSDFQGKTGVVYTPCDKLDFIPKKVVHDGIVFLYTGNLYGIRKIDSLLRAFRAFLKKHPQSKLLFVGNVYSKILSEYQDLVELSNVQLHPYTDDLSEYYCIADVLLDIGAAIDNDVFLSSKIVNYLAYKKPIVAITQNGSPAREIFRDAETIIHCHHNEKEIEEAMMKSLSLMDSQFEDREVYLKMFSAEVVANNFVDDILHLIDRSL